MNWELFFNGLVAILWIWIIHSSYDERKRHKAYRQWERDLIDAMAQQHFGAIIGFHLLFTFSGTDPPSWKKLDRMESDLNYVIKETPKNGKGVEAEFKTLEQLMAREKPDPDSSGGTGPLGSDSA